jgi:hypothetical protein
VICQRAVFGADADALLWRSRYNHGVEEERSAVPLSFAMLPKLLQSTGNYKTHMLVCPPPPPPLLPLRARGFGLTRWGPRESGTSGSSHKRTRPWDAGTA